MPTNTAPNTSPQAPRPADTGLKRLPFAFPFLPKRQGQTGTAAKFTDEHDIYQLLAKSESAGSYLVSSNGLWHGGIHVTEAGAGQSLDLDSGIVCIADGHVVAYRLNRAYLVSELPAQNGPPAVGASYSTGFVLVRHTMEFPKGTTLVFYSLYMHLQAYEDYANYPKRQKPSYWTRQFKVTGYAQDLPTTGKNGQVAGADQMGIRVRKSESGGEIIGILPQGASVSVGARKKGHGQITDMCGSSLNPRQAGEHVEPLVAVGKWIFMGNENGGPVVEEHMPDSSFDRVVITASQGNPGIPVKAGDLMGHLGRYDSLNQPTSGTRMAHIEVFCDDSVKAFIDQGSAWVDDHGPHPEDWKSLGLPADPTILRIAPHTKLYQDHKPDGEGADAPVTDVVQVYSLAELARKPDNVFTETQPNSMGRKVNWWQVDSANAMRNPIHGWVREESFTCGRVTREFAQSWVDFQCFDDAHDPAHTIFATTNAWVDYARGASVPNPGALDKLSALMQKVYRALFATGDGSRAADDLCNAARSDRDYPWLMQAASRLIVRHESEWANPGKWTQLVSELEAQGGSTPQHAEEQKRIERLAWWDEVKAGVPGFPASEVFHIHPIGLVGNFMRGQSACECGCCLQSVFKVTRYGHAPHTHYGPVFWGDIALEKSKALIEMRTTGSVSESEFRIVTAMSTNEGKIDAVQSYDSEILTAGAMQKTINPIGNGEFPTQVAEFKAANESDYQELFAKCGWTVEGTGDFAKMFYMHPELTQGVGKTGADLKDLLRQGCTADNFGQTVKSVPLAVIAHAITSQPYEKKQVMDFILRLRETVLPAKPRGYQYTIADYFQSDIGRATALDQSVNRPGHVTRDIGKSLDVLLSRYPGLSQNPNEWGATRAQYEREVIEYYGNSREMSSDSNGTSSSHRRYHNLLNNLN